MTYEYKCPIDQGYKQFKISRKDQNRIFKYRKWIWSINHEYYVKGNHIILQEIPNIYGCIVSTLLFPVGVLLKGLANTKETYRDMIVKVWQCKKYGSFSGDDIYKREGKENKTFNELMKCKKEI